MKMYLTFFGFLLFLVSCKKNADYSGCDITEVKSYNNGVSEGSSNYSYDEQHRLKTIKNIHEVITYQYFADSIVVSNLNYGTIYYLNSAGLAVSAKDFRTGPNPDQIKNEFSYTYNAEGYLTQMRYIFSQFYNGNTLKDTSFVNYTIANGNMVKMSGTNMSDIFYQYSDVVVRNTFPPFTSFTFGVGQFLGKPSVNAILTMKDISGTVITRYSYITDKSGNITQITSSNDNNGSRIRKEFIYSCK